MGSAGLLGSPDHPFSEQHSAKHTDRATLKFRGNERVQDYLASTVCMMPSKLLSLFHNAFVLLHLLLKFNSRIFVGLLCPQESVNEKEQMTKQNLMVYLPAHNPIISKFILDLLDIFHFDNANPKYC